jgi:hypothetical protein
MRLHTICLLTLLSVGFLYVIYSSRKQGKGEMVKVEALSGMNFIGQVKLDAKNQPHTNTIDYINQVDIVNINSLFDLLLDKESQYEKQLHDLNVLTFQTLIEDKYSGHNSTKPKNKAIEEFQKEIQLYLTVTDRKVHATEKFVEHLKNISKQYTKPVGTRYAIYPATISKVNAQMLDRNLILLYRQLMHFWFLDVCHCYWS